MKKIILTVLISFTLLYLFSGCKSAGNVNSDQSGQWIAVNNIDQLTGIWEDENGSLEFPKILDNKEYLLVMGQQNDDSKLWMDYSKKHNIPVKQAYAKKFAALGDVYGINYPISDSNGTQRGIKFYTPKIYTDYYVEILTRIDTLIPEEILYKNLSIFSLSKDGTQLKESGTFRFYSSKFQNEYIEERIFTKKQ